MRMYNFAMLLDKKLMLIAAIVQYSINQ